MPSPIGNYFIRTLVNSPLHPLVGKGVAVITVTGSKTGKSIETPINIIRVGETLMAISLRSRTWWRNLRGGRTAQLRYIGKLLSVHGEVVEAPVEVATGLLEIFAHYHGYAKFFNIKSNPDGKPNSRELERAASEHVLIKLRAA